jgi:hypothetical protein
MGIDKVGPAVVVDQPIARRELLADLAFCLHAVNITVGGAFV